MAEVEIKSDERIDMLVENDVKIIQSPEVFSFGMDAVLLSRFPDIPRRPNRLILDLCAGNGAVGLLASSATKARIIEIELQERLADMAERSVKLNGLDSQMRIICDDLRNTLQYVKASTADLIFCNPPYFKVSSPKNLNTKSALTLARHEVATDFETICSVAQQVLKPSGHLALVHRPDRFLEIIDTLRSYKLLPKQIQFVYPKVGAEANLFLIDAIKDSRPGGERFLPPLIVRDNHGNYSREIDEIYYKNK